MSDDGLSTATGRNSLYGDPKREGATQGSGDNEGRIKMGIPPMTKP